MSNDKDQVKRRCRRCGAILKYVRSELDEKDKSIVHFFNCSECGEAPQIKDAQRSA